MFKPLKKFFGGSDSGVSFINSYTYPVELIATLKNEHDYTDSDIEIITAQFKEFIKLCLIADHSVAMPSKAVDDLWHEFLLLEDEYKDFCDKALGRFLIHIPNDERTQKETTAELKNTWILACKKEGINPKNPMTVPSLFRVDRDLGVRNGYHYSTKRCGTTRRDGAAVVGAENNLVFPYFFLGDDFGAGTGIDSMESIDSSLMDNHGSQPEASVPTEVASSSESSHVSPSNSSSSFSSSDSSSSGSSCGSSCGGGGG